MLRVDFERRLLGATMNLIRERDFEYYDDFPIKASSCFYNLANTLGRMPELEEFLDSCKGAKTSFFQMNRISRDEFFHQLYRVFSNFELKFRLSTETEPSYPFIIETFSKKINEVIRLIEQTEKQNRLLADDIRAILNILMLQKAKTITLSSEISEIRVKLESLIRRSKMDKEIKDSYLSKLKNLGGEIGIETAATLLLEIAKKIVGIPI